MSCYHPLKAFPIGFHDSGKVKYKICSYDTEYVYPSGDSYFASKGGLMPFGAIYDCIEIPCGHCIGCRLDYSREWANRCMLERGYHEDAFFLTLTYDDEHLPKSCYADGHTGEALASYTLVKKDLQLFFKRLRKEYKDCHIRYYAAGEYGDKSFRPHYHAIVFGLHLTDLHFYKTTGGDNQFILYKSKRLEKVWSKGLVVISEVTWDTCAYVARYIMKKQKGEGVSVYETFNIESEFVTMSRKPGIGKQYFIDNIDKIYKYDKINLATEKEGVSFKPPRYYDKMYDIEYPEEMESIKLFRRAVAETMQGTLLRQIDIDYQEYLEVKEREHLNRTKILSQRDIPREKEVKL